MLLRFKGDGDPVDVIDIGTGLHKSGEVIQVKVLGCLAMIDEGQTDWKVIGIDVGDPLASKMSDISDVDVYMPDLLKMTTNWFRIYKARLPRKELESVSKKSHLFQLRLYASGLVKNELHFR